MSVSESFSGSLYFKTTINTTTGKHGYWVSTRASGPVDTTMYSNGVPTISPTVVGSVTTGSKYVVIQDTDGRTVVNMPSVVNSGGVRWTVSSVTGAGQTDTDGISYGTGTTNIILTAAGANAAASTTVVNSKGLTALASYSGTNAAMTSLSNAINNLTATADIEKAAAQLRPSTNGSTTQAALGAVGQAINTISIRTDSVRAASADTNGGTGVSSGESLRGLGVWTQGFGSSATQDKRLGVDGYSADTYGLAFGADVKVMEPVRVGVSFAYARTNVADSGSRDGSGQNINSYIGSLYGTYTANRWYVDGAVTYGKHDYSGTRVIAITGAATQTAKSSYSGEQYGAKAELGVPFPVGPATVTPLLSLAYNHLNQDAYTETNAAAALSVGSSSTDSIKSGLGAKVSATVAQWGDWNVKPNARAIWNHEFNSSSHNQTSAYVDGGSSFTNASSEIASESFNLGIGLDLASVRNTTLSAKYDAGLSDRYVSHTGSLQARMEF
ncbi:Outer membrane autotransporter barrel domain-containing protein (fragment) [Candidatus Terasakiella magnetica]